MHEHGLLSSFLINKDIALFQRPFSRGVSRAADAINAQDRLHVAVDAINKFPGD